MPTSAPRAPAPTAFPASAPPELLGRRGPFIYKTCLTFVICCTASEGLCSPEVRTALARRRAGCRRGQPGGAEGALSP